MNGMNGMNRNTRSLVSCAILAALVYVVTFLVQIPVPFAQGAYVNAGDAMVYAGAFFPGGIFAAAAAGIGSALADITVGASLYILPTLIIKFLMCLACTSIIKNMNGNFRFVLGNIAGGAIMVTGYFMYEMLMFGFAQAIVLVPMNLVQLAGGCALGLILQLSLSKVPKQLFR